MMHPVQSTLSVERRTLVVNWSNCMPGKSKKKSKKRVLVLDRDRLEQWVKSSDGQSAANETEKNADIIVKPFKKALKIKFGLFRKAMTV